MKSLRIAEVGKPVMTLKVKRLAIVTGVVSAAMAAIVVSKAMVASVGSAVMMANVVLAAMVASFVSAAMAVTMKTIEVSRRGGRRRLIPPLTILQKLCFTAPLAALGICIASGEHGRGGKVQP